MTSSEWFDAYLRNELEADQRLEFEKRLSEPGFSAAFRDHVEMINALEDHKRRKELFKNLNRIHTRHFVGSSRVDLQACKLEYSIVSPK